MTETAVGESGAALVEKVASDYRAKGYDVTVQPSSEQLPAPLAAYRPDIVARKGDESVVVEVKSRHALRQSPQAQQLATAVRQLPGWRFELVVARPEIAFPLPVGAQPWDTQDIKNALDEASTLLHAGHHGPALLVAWAATEAALRLLAAKEGISVERSEANALLNRLTAYGVLTRQQFRALISALEIRNALAHGLRAASVEPSQVRGLIAMAGELLLPAAAE